MVEAFWWKVQELYVLVWHCLGVVVHMHRYILNVGCVYCTESKMLQKKGQQSENDPFPLSRHEACVLSVMVLFHVTYPAASRCQETAR